MSNNPNRDTAKVVVRTFISNIRTNAKIDDASSDGNNFVIGYLTGFLQSIAESDPEVMETISAHADLIRLQIETKQAAAATEETV